MIRVEYLLSFNIEDEVCINKKSFLSLLESHSKIKINNDDLTFNKKRYKITVDLNETNNKIFIYHVILSCEKLNNDFSELNKAFRIIVWKYQKNNYQVIWDWIWYEYSQELYPIIYELENFMRILISKFMLTTLWLSWAQESSKNIQLRKWEAKDNSILYKIDFIDLWKYLFSEYARKEWLEEYVSEQEKTGFKNI